MEDPVARAVSTIYVESTEYGRITAKTILAHEGV
jgi:hypothetical protein